MYVLHRIELNPVRAEMVHPAEYPWSSYRHNALGDLNNLIKPHIQYEQLGTTRENRLKNYQELFKLPLEQEVVDEIRESANKGWGAR
jgi:putative transposase